MAESRTKKSVRNSSVAMFTYIVNLILQFYSRKIFLEYLGTEILGLNTTATNLLQFLNLAELGISSAVAFCLYKPIHKGEKDIISEIISFQGHIYRRIAYFILGGAFILMLFFPFIFSKIKLPLWYAYLSFGVLLFSSLLSYFVNYKQIALSASQQDYKITISYKSWMILKVAVQMLAVWNFKNGYLWWVFLEFLFSIIASVSLHIVTIRNFPYLNKKKYNFRELRLKYKIIETKVKQLFFHKASGFALAQTSPLILYAYTSLSTVTYYQNYMLIFSGMISLMASTFNGITASIGNVSAENPDKMFPVFKELFSFQFFISSICSFSFYIITPGFISLWIGSSYMLPNLTTALISIYLFIALSRQTVENFLFSQGLFQDIWAPIIETCINLGMSIFLGYYFGLNGILSGMIISLLVIVLCWKPYFLFSRGFKLPIRNYISIYVKHLLIFTISIIIGIFILRYFALTYNTWIDLILSVIKTVIVFGITMLSLMIIAKCGISNTLKRIFKYVNH